MFTKVGQLDQLVDGRYAFRYLPPASEDPDFFPLDEFPHVGRAYVSDALPSFFANRVMSHDRPHTRVTESGWAWKTMAQTLRSKCWLAPVDPA